MKAVHEVAIKFLIGAGLAVLIGFLFWWFIIHNESDRLVEKSFKKFYSALSEACERGYAEVYVEIPQRKYSTPLDAIKSSIETAISKISGEKFKELPFQAFEDPYYKFYWESFPPELPYHLSSVVTDVVDVINEIRNSGDEQTKNALDHVFKIGKGVVVGLVKSILAFFLPWSEDLPWSNNIMLTMAFSTFALGVDILGVKSVQTVTRATLSQMKNAANKLIDKLAESSKLLKDLFNGIETVIDKVKGGITKVIVKLEKIGYRTRAVFRIAKAGAEFGVSVLKTTGIYTALCWIFTDYTLKECFIGGLIGATFTQSIMRITLYVVNKINIVAILKHELLGAIDIIKTRISTSIASIFEGAETSEDIEYIFEKIGEIQKLSDEYKYYLDEAKKKYLKGEPYSDLYESARQKAAKIEQIISELEEEFLSKVKITEDNVISVFWARADLDVAKQQINEIKNLPPDIVGDMAKGYQNIYKLKENLGKYIENNIVKPKTKHLEKLGFKFRDDGKLVLERPLTGEDVIFEDFEAIIKVYEIETGIKPTEIETEGGKFYFEYDKDGNLKKVIFDPESLKNKIMEKMKKPFEILETLVAENIGILYNKVISSETLDLFAEELLKEIDKPEQAKKLLEGFRKAKIKDIETVEDLKKLILNFKNNLGEDTYGALIEKDTGLAKLLESLSESEIKDPRILSKKIREFLFDVVDNNRVDEIRRMYDLFNGKRWRWQEDLGKFFRRGILGYALLRAIDFYTPLGATYWDRYFSYYGYEGQRVPEGCQPSCSNGKVCLHLGACVREFNLPENCKKAGIKEIKLDRKSIIAANPRFYLVSPCYGKVKIRADKNSGIIYVSVDLDRNKQPNYCYATTEFVNYYVLMRITQILARCGVYIACVTGISWIPIIGQICAATELTTGALVAACLFGSAPSCCGVIVDIVDLAFNIYEETRLIWPTVYEFHPWLASWMN